MENKLAMQRMEKLPNPILEKIIYSDNEILLHPEGISFANTHVDYPNAVQLSSEKARHLAKQVLKKRGDLLDQETIDKLNKENKILFGLISLSSGAFMSIIIILLGVILMFFMFAALIKGFVGAF